jgi:hypothetical protein
MKAGWTKIVLAVWLTAWASALCLEADMVSSVFNIAVLGITTLLAYQCGKGDRAWM